MGQRLQVRLAAQAGKRVGTSHARVAPGAAAHRRKDGGSPSAIRGLSFPTPSSDTRMRSPGAGAGVGQV